VLRPKSCDSGAEEHDFGMGHVHRDKIYYNVVITQIAFSWFITRSTKWFVVDISNWWMFFFNPRKYLEGHLWSWEIKPNLWGNSYHGVGSKWQFENQSCDLVKHPIYRYEKCENHLKHQVLMITKKNI